MELFFEIIKSLLSSFATIWQLWVLVLIAAIFKLFAPQIKGFMGEKSVAFFLSRLDPAKYKIINNIMLQVGGKITQLDHVVVSNYGIFVIETKNYQGWIMGDEFYFYYCIYNKG